MRKSRRPTHLGSSKPLPRPSNPEAKYINQPETWPDQDSPKGEPPACANCGAEGKTLNSEGLCEECSPWA